MVDFSKLASSVSINAETDPRKIFNSLVKPDGVNELYVSQGDVLEKWYNSRTQNTHIIKLPTGGGKSIVGLLMAYSTINELTRPAVYLVPTKQLVKQVCDEADRFGIPARQYVSAKDGLHNDVIDATAICVATYDAVFNGKSVFGTVTKESALGDPGIVILDDAHAAFETVWDNYSFVINRKDHSELYTELCSKFRNGFQEIGKTIRFDDVLSRKDNILLEIPHWDWQQKCEEIGALLQQYGTHKIDLFSWEHIKDEMHVCHAIMSRDNFSIVPVLPAVEKSTAFRSALRHVFMSATIANDSEVVRTFGASAKHVGTPIVAASLAGVGERLILAPSLTKLPALTKEREAVSEVVKDLIHHNKNTLVLTASFEKAGEWSPPCAASKKAEESEKLIESLKTSQGSAVAVPRRYDGIDLPGEHCRLLVLDGLPYGASDYDLWRMHVLSGGIANAQLAQRIEQAIGRGSRGTSDYCVVALTGSDLVNWLGRKVNQSFLSSATKRQLEIGLNVSKEVRTADEFKATVWQCLNRDAGWRAYHASEMSTAAIPEPPEQKYLQMWELERKGIDALRIRQSGTAISYFDEAISLADEATSKAWFHQLKARAFSLSLNQAEAEQSQAKAYQLNIRLTPPRGAIKVEVMHPPGQQALMICNKVDAYMYPHVAISVFEGEMVECAPYATSTQFEIALEKLFSWVGLASSRPDNQFKQGPDNLAISEDGFAIVVEAKSRKKTANRFTKTQHGQVLSHENWFNANYSPQTPRQRVVVHPTIEAELNAGTQGTKVLTFDIISSIITDVKMMLNEIVILPQSNRVMQADLLLDKFNLRPNQLVNRMKNFSDI